MLSLYYETNFPIEQYRDDLVKEQKKFRELETDFIAYNGAMEWYQVIKKESQEFIKENFLVAQEVILHFQEYYGIYTKPRYFRQLRGLHLKPHVDINTKCAFNYILNDDVSPIIFHLGEGKTHTVQYTKALVNVQAIHEVPSSDTDRLLFKLSITDENYQDVLKKVLDKEKTLMFP